MSKKKKKRYEENKLITDVRKDIQKVKHNVKDIKKYVRFSNMAELNGVYEEEPYDGYTLMEDELEEEYPDSENENELDRRLLLKDKSATPRNKKARQLYNLARGLIYKLNILILEGRDMLVYDPQLGRYEKEQETLRCICSALPETDVENLPTKDLKEIAEYIRISAEEIHIHADQLNGNDRILNCENGVVDLENQTLLEHSPEHYFSYCIRADYLENNQDICCPNFEKFCKTSLDNDPEKRQLLLEIIGYCCCDANAGKCGLFLKGEADSGKSVILEFISRLFDRSLVANIPLHELSSPFNRAELFGKKINIAGEIKGKALSDITTYKSLTGGDRISGERKGKDPFFFTPRCKLLFAGNTLPGTTEADATTAFANRITVLLFNRSIPKDQQDKKLGDKLWDERNSIFSLAIRALFKLRKKNYVFTRPGESQSYIEAFCAKENSVQLFLKECCELGADLRVFNVELLRAYSDYCRDNGLVELKKGLFYDLLDGIPGVRYKKIRIKGENRWGREGITLKK